MREHWVPCDNLIPVQTWETFRVELVNKDGHHYLHTIVGDLQQLERYEELGFFEED